jgi:hypothetical protein
MRTTVLFGAQTYPIVNLNSTVFSSDYILKDKFFHHRQTPACMIVYGNKTVKLSFIRG